MRMPARRRPRYAEVTTVLAVVVALGGTSYAVTAVPRDSVGTAQLKAHAVTKSKLATGSLDGRPLLALSAPRGRPALPEPRAPPCPESPGTRSWSARRRPTSNPRWPFARPESGRSEAAERCLTALSPSSGASPMASTVPAGQHRGTRTHRPTQSARRSPRRGAETMKLPTTTLRRRRRDACAHRRPRRHQLCRHLASLATAWAPRNSRPTPSRRPSSQPASPSRAHAARKGRRGLTGPAGAPGPPGTPGVSGYEIVTADSGTTGTAQALCPAGKRVLGGGGFMYEGIERLFRSFPLPNGAGWEADGSNIVTALRDLRLRLLTRIDSRGHDDNGKSSGVRPQRPRDARALRGGVRRAARSLPRLPLGGLGRLLGREPVRGRLRGRPRCRALRLRRRA